MTRLNTKPEIANTQNVLADVPERRFGFDGARRGFQPPAMKPDVFIRVRSVVFTWAVMAAFPCLTFSPRAADAADAGWRRIPLLTDGKVDPNWAHTGWGGMVVDDGALRTECDPKGLGLLVYKKERLGNCQVRVVFKAKDARSNAGVYVRIADGIIGQLSNPGAAFERDAAGQVSKESMEKMQASADREEGPWYAVHHGYEVQIADGGDPTHGTGAIYSLASRTGVEKRPGEWRTMIITLDGDKILVDLDGKRVTTFDSAKSTVPARKQWHEPKREHRRPQVGYIGLQNHDPGDVVWFKEVSVRPL